MSSICDRCGAEKRARPRTEDPVPCIDCQIATIYLRIPFGSEEKVLSWLERVIDRRVRKAFVERRLP